ncbi:class D sortase [Candidatus Saccharibacteria bacterium TM7i]|nr:class D sortase [Candidatus Saccharibacteria bacterium TM7i]
MNPNSQSQGGGFTGAPNNQTPVQPAQQNPQTQSSAAPAQREATINVLRTQIDSLYGDNPVTDQQAVHAAQAQQTHAPTQQNTQPQQVAAAHSVLDQTALQQNLDDASNPYNRSIGDSQKQTSIDPKQWKDYHSAWQDYYQKYYAAYYAHQDAQKEQRKKDVSQALEQSTEQTQPQAIGSAPLEQPQAAPQESAEDISKAQAMQELRNRLLGKVKDRAQKVRKSRHFMPIAAALVVILIFVFIQYNRVFIATVNAYVSPGSIDPQNIVINPASNGVVGEESRLIIPKINVDVPVLYDVGADHNSQMDAMEKGVAHFAIPGAKSHPGEKGNTVLSGHSSNDLFDKGDYKFIFAQLDKLTDGDTIYANYKGKRYTYVVTRTEVVKPTQVDKLVYPTDKPIMTLITCTPLGTSLNRLLVTAEQISPDPAEATTAPATGDTEAEAPMPGNSATLLERLFGRR